MTETVDFSDPREKLIRAITDIIAAHQLLDYASKCHECYKELYGQGDGSTLTRHRAEKIVDGLDLVSVFAKANITL